MNEQPITVETTADGANTLYRPDLDEHYHSTKGALTESRHVYINCGLRHFAETLGKNKSEPIKILEIGFGTGLDAMLAIEFSQRSKIHTDYLGLENVPLSSQTIETMGFEAFIDATIINAVANSPWNQKCQFSDSATFEKRIADATVEVDKLSGFDVIFMDAFAPEKQPELWTPAFLNSLVGTLNAGGVITTYCAKGVVRRTFQNAGLICERLEGPQGGKREILRATKPI